MQGVPGSILGEPPLLMVSVSNEREDREKVLGLKGFNLIRGPFCDAIKLFL